MSKRPVDEKHHVFLVPGFFGFANLGGLMYFVHVAEFLQNAFARLGMDVQIHRVPTHPTASIRRRAAMLLEWIAKSEAGESGLIHLVGHSTGGLDGRLLASPDVSLAATQVPVEPIAARIRTIVGVSTPHYGTPLSSFFTTVFGKQLLKVLSISTVYVMRFGQLPLSVMLEIGALLTRLDNLLGWKYTVADQIFSELLGDFTSERRKEVEELLSQAGGDQSLIRQLSPEGADIFNAGTRNRPGVRYGSVVAAVPTPGLRSVRRVGLNPYAHATHILFNFLYRASRGASVCCVPALTREQDAAFRRWLDRPPSVNDGDGIVPSLSQVWGDVVCAVVADHLDAIGHFSDEKHDPPHYDWLASGSGFNRQQFERLWTAVATYVAGV